MTTIYQDLLGAVLQCLGRDYLSKKIKITPDERARLSEIFDLSKFGVTNQGQPYAFDTTWVEFFNKRKELLCPNSPETFEEFKVSYLTMTNFATGKNGRRGRYLVLPIQGGSFDSDNDFEVSSDAGSVTSETSSVSSVSSEETRYMAYGPRRSDWDNQGWDSRQQPSRQQQWNYNQQQQSQQQQQQQPQWNGAGNSLYMAKLPFSIPHPFDDALDGPQMPPQQQQFGRYNGSNSNNNGQYNSHNNNNNSNGFYGGRRNSNENLDWQDDMDVVAPRNDENRARLDYSNVAPPPDFYVNRNNSGYWSDEAVAPGPSPYPNDSLYRDSWTPPPGSYTFYDYEDSGFDARQDDDLWN